MKKSTILKTILLIAIFTIITCMCTTVFADDETLDLTDSLTGGSSSTQEDENTPTEQEPEQPAVDATPDAETNTEEDANTDNSSTYEESEIPYAGPTESILMAIAFVAFAITGIYTFIKLSDYSNI